MPRSKRSKLVTLAQTDKKGRENKERIFNEVRAALDTYRYVFVLYLDDVRTPVLQEIRNAWTGSKLILGKRKVLEKAFGTRVEDEYRDGLHKLSAVCKGTTGLLFTDESVDTVVDYFESYSRMDYARPNSKAPSTFVIPEGIIYSRGGQIPADEDVPMVHSLEPTLRNKFEIPTRIQKGKITIDQPYQVCEKGQVLDVRQALILKQFGIAATEFKVKLAGYYDRDSAEVKDLKVNMD